MSQILMNYEFGVSKGYIESADMLTLPEEVICGCILPHLSFGELQTLDTACTNKLLRPRLRSVWKSYQYDSLDEVLYEYDFTWLCRIGVKIVSVTVDSISTQAKSVLASLTTLQRLHLKSGGTRFILMLLARNNPDLKDISFDRLCGREVKHIGRSLAYNCPQLHAIRMSCRGETLRDIQALCENCPLLQHISLLHCSSLTDAALIAIADTYPHLKSLNIEGNNEFTCKGLICLANHCHELQSLSLKVTSKTSRGLTSLWAANPNLREVNLPENCVISDDDLVQLVQYCPNLRHLNISCNSQISDAGVIAVAEHCPQLQSLNASGCTKLTNAALSALGQHCRELTSIQISCAHGSDVDITVLVSGCPLLQDFSGSGLGFTDVHVIALARGCRDLRKLNLSYSNISVVGLCAIVANCPLLSELILQSADSVDNACMYAIAQYCRNLTVLNIDGTAVAEVAAVQSVIASCRMLRKLICGRCFDKETNLTLRRRHFRIDLS